MKIIQAMGRFERCYPEGNFSLEAWQDYMNEALPEGRQIFFSDMEQSTGGDRQVFERECIPVLQTVLQEDEKRRQAIRSFEKVTAALEERIARLFGRVPRVTVVLTVGLCNGAGWATEIQGQPYVLLGMEKILELNWWDERSMVGLVVHELGHLYHWQFGRAAPAGYLGTLFSEGVAMVFEQMLMEDKDFFHQDTHGWRDFCQSHLAQIKGDFDRELPGMERENQRYFGDGVRYEGYGDVGYYLGARFVQWLHQRMDFDGLIRLSGEQLRIFWQEYAALEA